MTIGTVARLIVISALVTMCGCDILDPNRQIITGDRTIPLIAVSPEVDRLLSIERLQDATASRRLFDGSKEEGVGRFGEFLKDPDLYYPLHGNFLNAMAQQPSLAIPPKSYLILLDNSGAKCDKPYYATNFVKVRVTSGSLEGRVGWVCENYVYRTVVWP